jgi:hypothetical protein
MGSNISTHTGYSEDFCGFPQPFQTDAAISLKQATAPSAHNLSVM